MSTQKTAPVLPPAATRAESRDHPWRQSLRIIWAITAKDILEALKNKNTIAVILTSLFMVAFYRWMPALFHGSEPTNLLIYDAGSSALVASLENNQTFDIYTYTSQEQMLRVLANGDLPELGLVIPAGFDQALAEGRTPELQGYVMYWLDESRAAEMQAAVETEIAGLLGQTVPIQMAGRPVYHLPDSDGLGVQAAIAVTFILLMIGVNLIAHLMLEEQQSNTLEALLVSPASAGQIVAAKALVGLFYCLLGAGVALALNQNLIVHWWLAALAIVAGAFFTIGLGLWLGLRIETRDQLTLWSFVILVPLLLPIFLSLLDPLVPETVVRVLRWVPTVVLFNLLRTSFANPIPVGPSLLQLSEIALWAAGVLWLVARKVRTLDLAPESSLDNWRSQMALSVQSGAARLLAPISNAFPRQEAPTAAPPERPQPLQWPPQTASDTAPTTGVRAWLRITGAIAAKDVREATHNKLIVSILLGVTVMMASNALIPRLVMRQNTPTAIVYDPGHSTNIRALAARDGLRLGIVESQQELERMVSEALAPRLGLIIPPDFDQQTGSSQAGSQTIQVDGYAVHWADPTQIDQWAAFFEEQFTQAGSHTVQIDLSHQPLYPSDQAGGQPMMVAILQTVVLLTLGVALVPLLLVQEKENHTLEVLLSSPASLSQVISGKALAGMVYGLAAAAVLLLFNRYLFVSWGAVLLTTLVSVSFAVAIGLMVGMLSNNPATTGLWGAGLLLVLITPTMLVLADLSAWPAPLQTLLAWQPGAIMINLFRSTMAEQVQLTMLLARLLALSLQAGCVFLLVGWLVRRAQR